MAAIASTVPAARAPNKRRTRSRRAKTTGSVQQEWFSYRPLVVAGRWFAKIGKRKPARPAAGLHARAERGQSAFQFAYRQEV
jgi:hypothetical protein